MAQIHVWKCDICGKEFREKEAGFDYKHETNIEIYLSKYESGLSEKYPDTCYECRRTLFNAIEDTLDKLTN